MKTSVIICEFNPLHFGHKRLIDYAKTFSDNVVCVMSGNFVQRGMPSCCNKYKRALHALMAGADLVAELPTVFATASAEDFALGGVKAANELRADFLVFGSECGDIDKLHKCVDKLKSDKVNAKIHEELSRGASYPKAVAAACESDIADKPNNVLAMEYLRALEKTNSRIVPMTLIREDNFNGEPQLFASSSALRQRADLRGKYTFDFVARDINDKIEKRYCEFAVRFLSLAEANDLQNTAGISEGLQNRIFAADKTHGFEKMIEEIKTKRYTRLKIQRIVLNTVLGIDKDTAAAAKALPPAIKFLGVKKGKEQLMSGIENRSDSVTMKADRFFAALEGTKQSTKLIVL